MRPTYLQELTAEAEAEIKRGIAGLLFDRINFESDLEKKDKKQKLGIWGDIVG